MKRLFTCILLIITISLFSVTSVLCSDSTEASASIFPVDITAKSGILIDGVSGKVLFEKNSHEKLHPASVTKIMTLLLTMEAIDCGKISTQDIVTASPHAVSMGGSQIWLKEGETMSVNDLLKATAVASANDASMALAEYVGGSETEFVRMMNEKAVELSMKDTCFVNPTGLDADGHYTSAYDIALMTKELLKHEKIKEYTTIWMDSLRGGKTELVNTNKLIRFYKGATGMKTGTTSKAGSCVSATATRGDIELIAVVMGAGNSKDRFDSAKRILDYGFSNFVVYKPVTTEQSLSPIIVKNGVEQSVKATVTLDKRLIIPAGKQKAVTEKITMESELVAPIKKNQTVGTVKIMIEDSEIASYDITTSSDVAEMTFSSAFAKLINTLIDM